MDDEEYTYQALQEPLYRVETGNYEYRLVLRCRQEARKRFAALRSDVLVKLELLDQKHVHNIAMQITRFIAALASFNTSCHAKLLQNSFTPFELDLSKSCLLQSTLARTPSKEDEYHDDEVEEAIELVEGDSKPLGESTSKPSSGQSSQMQSLIDIFAVGSESQRHSDKSKIPNDTNDEENKNKNQVPSKEAEASKDATVPADLLLF